MPYIKRERRKDFKSLADLPEIENAGELNYVITLILLSYMMAKPYSYQRINDCVGACEGAKMEFARRFVGKYEDQKILENGDVYP